MVTMKKSVTMEAVKSLLLEWDGDGSGLEAVETAGGTLYKVADVIVQNEDIPGMTVTDNEGKETLVTDRIYNDMISRSLVGDGFAAKVAGYVYLAQKAGQAPGAELPAGGIWLLKKQDGSYPKKVVLPAYREAFLQGEKPDGEKGESMGGGGARSWNDLTDKPFYEETTVGEIKVEYTKPAENGGWYKGSDLTPTIEEIQSATVVLQMASDTYTFKAPFIVFTDDENFGPGGYALVDGNDTYDLFFVLTKPNDEYPEPGIYFQSPTTITYTGVTTEIKTLDPKFLPEGYPSAKIDSVVDLDLKYDDCTYHSDDNYEHQFSRDFADFAPEVDTAYTVTIDGVTFDAIGRKYSDGYVGDMYYLGNGSMYSGAPDTGEPFCLMFPSSSYYEYNIRLDTYLFGNGGFNSITVSHIAEVISPLDPKFLPEGVGGDNYDVVIGISSYDSSLSNAHIVSGDWLTVARKMSAGEHPQIGLKLEFPVTDNGNYCINPCGKIFKADYATYYAGSDRIEVHFVFLGYEYSDPKVITARFETYTNMDDGKFVAHQGGAAFDFINYN